MSKLSQTALKESLVRARQQVVVGAQYEHYKGNVYTVLDIALLEATNEPCVIYRAEYGERLVWIRPVSDWLKEVEWQGKQISRFAKLSDSTQ